MSRSYFICLGCGDLCPEDSLDENQLCTCCSKPPSALSEDDWTSLLQQVGHYEDEDE